MTLDGRLMTLDAGEPATEVLRQKLPLGVRELAVSLGSGDAAAIDLQRPPINLSCRSSDLS